MRILLFLLCAPLFAQPAPKCEAANPPASLTVKFSNYKGDLNSDPRSRAWRKAQSATIVKDCSRQLDYPNVKSEVRSF